jgi:hypothetical protein
MELVESVEPYLCLNMIVKNEGHIIKDTLTKLLNKVPIIDYWVISDTGSTDKTKEIISDFFKERNIKGELFDDEWKDFGHNRTLAVQHAFGKSKYLLVFDADDEICGDFVLPDLKVDSYHLQFGDANGTSYTRTQIVNNKKKWKYVGVLHEIITCTEHTDGMDIIKGKYYTISGKSGSRSQDQNKYQKDALILEKAYEEAVKNNDELYNRYGFYCANSYYDSGKWEDAIKWYKITLDNKNWSQEKYVACQRLYNCYNALNQKETGMFYLVKSFSYDKERTECLFELVSYYCCNDMNDIAYNYYNIVKSFYNQRYLKDGLNDKLFLDVSKANLFLPYYMILVSDKVKDYDTTIQMYRIIFTKKHIERSKHYIGNMLYNLQFFIDRIKDDNEFLRLFQEYVEFLISINYPIYDHEFMSKYEKYGLILPKFSEPVFSLDDCLKSKNILLYSGYSPLKWNYTFSINNALGGSETAISCLTKNFPKDYTVYVAGEVEEETVENIRYVHFNSLNNLIKTTAFHTIIVSRYLNFYELYRNFSAYKTFIWGHDITLYAYGTDLSLESILTKWESKITGCICQTEWHKNLFLSSFPQLKDKISTINNGINIDLFNSNHKTKEKINNRFIYTSCSERGLYKLVQLWPSILENLPDAELLISSYNNFPKSEEDNKILEIINKTPSIKHMGKLNREELYNLMATAEYWLYTSYFQETSCITSLELLASEVICFYYPVAGLVNTLGDYGIPVSEGNEIDKILNYELIYNKSELKRKGKEYALSCSWKNRAIEWCNIFFSKEKEKPKWCFYYQNFTIETISQFLKNQFNHNGTIYEIIITNNKDEIINSKPHKVTFIHLLFDESILQNINDNCEFSILQTEPLNLPWRLNSILEIHKNFPQLKIYDYSKSNIKILNQYDITNFEYLAYNIHSDERNKLISFMNENKNNQIYDFGLIYNWKSLPLEKQHIINPPRRRNIVDFLKKNGLNVNIVAGYDDDRDIELSKCKFILNIHGQINDNPTPSPDECSNIFEHIRCDRLLESGYNILSETSYELDDQYIKKHNKNLTIINYDDFFDIDIINKLVETNKTKKYCFIHSCNLENVGTYRLENLIQTLRVTECENIFDKIYINNIGLPIENIYGEKYEVTNCSGNSQLFENPTINLINDFSKENPNCYILYLHTKGIRYSKEDGKENDWINYMLYFLVEEYKNCISILNSKYDTVGCDYSIDLDQNVFNGYEPYPPPPHYSGNFWWANSNYLKNLPKLCMEKPDRNAPEFWLFQNKPKFYNLHSSNVNHFRSTYPRDIYVRKLESEKTMSEMVDNLRTDKNTTHSYLDLYEKLLFTKKCTAKNILEIGIGHGKYDGICITNGGSIKLWHDYFLNANIYALDIVSIDNVWDGIKNNNRINLITSVDAYDTDFFTETFLNTNTKFDMLLDDGPHTLESMIQFIKLYVNVMAEEGILIIEDIQSIDWIQALTEVVPEHLQKYISSYDLRHIKNRYDDIVFVINKNTFADNDMIKNNNDDIKYNTNKIDSENNVNLMLQYGKINNTDKVTHHEYHKYYDYILKHFYNSQGSIVEIGIGTGVSLPMWISLFKNAHIYGVDIETEDKTNERYTIFKADQSNIDDLNILKSSLIDKNVFFINDDGSHIPEHQLLSFNVLFPILVEGGIYIIEDIETSYWTKGECYGYKTNYGYKHPKSIVEIFKETLDIMNREFIIEKTQLSNKILHYNYIDSVTFGRNCIIIKKGYNANREYRFKIFL